MKKILIVVGVLAVLGGGGYFIVQRMFVRTAKACLLGSGARAVEDCTNAIKFDSSADIKTGLLMRRSDLNWKAGQIAEALADARAALELKEKGKVEMPADVQAQLYNSLVLLNSKAGNAAEAQKFTDPAIENGSKEPLVYLTRATRYVLAKDYASSLADLKKAEALGFKQRIVYYSEGRAYRELGDLENAYKSFKTAETMNAGPEDAAVLSPELGLTCYGLKRYAEAIPYLKQALAAGAPCEKECSEAITASEKALRPAKAGGKRRK